MNGISPFSQLILFLKLNLANLYKYLNLTNLSTLFRALYNEPFSVILQNLNLRIQGDFLKPIRIHINDTNANFTLNHAGPVGKYSYKISGKIKSEQEIIYLGVRPNFKEDISVEISLMKEQGSYSFDHLINSESKIKHPKFYVRTSNAISADYNLPSFPLPAKAVLNEDQHYQLFVKKENEIIEGIKSKELTSFKVLLTLRKENANSLIHDTLKSLTQVNYKNWECLVFWDSEISNELKIEHRILNYIHFDDHKSLNQIYRTALSNCSKDFILFISPKLSLHKRSLTVLDFELSKLKEEITLIYTNEDHINKSGIRNTPVIKPDFDFDLFLSINYIQYGLAINRKRAEKVGWTIDESSDLNIYDLILRLTEQYSKDSFVNSTKFLFHRKEAIINDSHSIKSDVDRYLIRNQVVAKTQIINNSSNTYIDYTISNNPKVSIVIPFKDKPELLKTCISSIFKKTKHNNFEILLVDHESKNREVLTYCEELQNKYQLVKYYKFSGGFNYSAINNWAARKATGDYLLLLNNDTEVLTSGWIKHFLSYAQFEENGIIGALLLYPDDTIQHDGVKIGFTDKKQKFPFAKHINKHLTEQDSKRYYPDSIKKVKAVTAACMMISKKDFDHIGGFDSEQLPISFSDVDLCLKVLDLGKKCLVHPLVKLYHFESQSRENTSKKFKRRESKELQHVAKKHHSHFNSDSNFIDINYEY